MIKELSQTQPAAPGIDPGFGRQTSLSEVIDKLNEVVTELNRLSTIKKQCAEEFLKGLNGSGGSK